MQQLHGTIQHYAWGTHDAIPTLLGREPDGRPHAEYWLGAHPLSPSRTEAAALDALIEEYPDLLGERVLDAFGPNLPFLMKVLSARHALSIQAHPSREQAQEGFARENTARIPVDSPERVYSDDWPKPEVMIALDTFETLSGFRDPMTTAALFSGLGLADDLASVIGPLTERKGSAALAEVFLDALSLAGDRAHLIDVTVAAAMRHANDPGPVGDFARTAVELDEVFPGDRAILAGLLMNRVVLQPGEALYVPAGHMHAHLRGTGIEVMGSSDNVIRGGLTPKHVDVSELVRVVDFEPDEPRVLRPKRVRAGVERYPTPCPEFDVWRVTAGAAAEVLVPGRRSARILLVVEGNLEVSTGDEFLALERGQAALLGATEDPAFLTGQGLAFVSASGLR
ncbi:MAG: mannose-6-phosphate isomerase, class I [Propionicimonas sp.]